MKKNQLGKSDVTVTDLCLGTMTFGTQTSEADAHRQIDIALDHGINFLDSAEMYPVNPVRKETCGESEAIVGRWIAQTGRRDDIVIATKIAGAGGAVRGGAPISPASIPEAVEGSLNRLQVDTIDLYQLHWPNRGSYMFRQNWRYDPTGQDRQETRQHMEDTLGALAREVEKGRIRAVGLSNESAWGTAAWLNASEAGHGPRMATIQNEYSLLCRLFDTDLSELSHQEDVGLLSFSPLAAGYLTGKYRGDAVPEGSRMSLNPNMGGRKTDRVADAVDVYQAVADNHGLDLAQMSLAWARSRKFMTSVIFGATTADQLDRLLPAAHMELSDDVLRDIDDAHRVWPMPY